MWILANWIPIIIKNIRMWLLRNATASLIDWLKVRRNISKHLMNLLQNLLFLSSVPTILRSPNYSSNWNYKENSWVLFKVLIRILKSSWINIKLYLETSYSSWVNWISSIKKWWGSKIKEEGHWKIGKRSWRMLKGKIKSWESRLRKLNSIWWWSRRWDRWESIIYSWIPLLANLRIGKRREDDYRYIYIC